MLSIIACPDISGKSRTAGKYLLLLFVVFLFTQFTSLAQAPDTMWTKTFEETIEVIIQTNDEGFVLGGKASGGTYVAKLNQYGDIVWTNISSVSVHGYGMVIPNLYELNSERYVMGFGDVYQGIQLIYSNGDSVSYFAVSHPGQNGPVLTQMRKTYDDNYILVYIGVAFLYYGQFEKVDSLGNVLWGNGCFPGAYLIQTKDSAFAYIGHNDWNSPLALVKTDIYGDVVWTQEYQNTTSLSGVCLEQVGDEGYVILGNEDNQNVRLLRTNEFGELIWEKTYGQSGMIYSSKFFTNTPDGGYIIVGSTGLIGVLGSDVWVLKTDSLGNIKWTKTMGGTGNEYGKYIQTTSDGGYIVAADNWIIKLEPDPTVYVDNEINIIKNYNLSQNYPNPFNPSTTIQYSIKERSPVELVLYDILGRQVEVLVNEDQDAGQYKINLNAGGLASSIYFYRIQAGSFVETKKMILLK